jgi:hypothetical protein
MPGAGLNFPRENVFVDKNNPSVHAKDAMVDNSCMDGWTEVVSLKNTGI